MTRRYSDADRRRAREVYEAEGLAAAVKATGVPRSTLRLWADREKWTVPATGSEQKARARTEAARATLEHKRTELSHEALDGARQLVVEMFTPYTYKHVVTLRDAGEFAGQYADIVEVPLPAPNARDRQALATAMGILVDKAQLLAGKGGEGSTGEPDDEIKGLVAKVYDMAVETARLRGA
jgi:hypothetical protein